MDRHTGNDLGKDLSLLVRIWEAPGPADALTALHPSPKRGHRTPIPQTELVAGARQRRSALERLPAQ